MRVNLFTFSFKLILFSMLLAVLFYFTGSMYKTAASKNLVNLWNEQRFNDFYAAEKDTVDLVFIGSSHSYCTFDPEIFDRELGVNSYQMGMPLQHPDSTYYSLKEIFNYQTPKTVVMEIYFDMLNEPFEIKQVDSLFLVLKNNAIKKEFEKNFPLNEKVKFYLPPIRYQKDFLTYANTRLAKKLDVMLNIKKAEENKGEEYYKTKGFIYCDYKINLNKNQFVKLDGTNWVFDSVQQRYLTEIIRLCKEKEAELLFVTAPLANISMEYISNYNAIHDKISRFADRYGIPYLDFNIANMEEGLFTNDHFRDDAHLNYSGVKIADEYFIRWMKSLNNAVLPEKESS